VEPLSPKYLDALGASILVIGLWSAGKNLLEGFLYWGGGELSNRLGTRGTLALVGFVPLAGYVVFLATHSVPAAIIASFLIGSWNRSRSRPRSRSSARARNPARARWRSRSSRSRSACRRSSARSSAGSS